MRSTGSPNRKRNPARTPRCSSDSVDTRSEKRPCTVLTSAAEATKQAAFSRKTTDGAVTPTRTPPITGPSTCPAFRPTATVPLAHATWSAATRFGTAAVDAE